MTAFIIPTRTLPGAAQLILGLLADGMNDSQIADAIGERRGVVGTETRRTLTALGAESRAQAVAMAYRQGWLNRVPSPRRGRPLAARELEAVQLLVAGATEAHACEAMGLRLRGLRLNYQHAAEHLGARTRPHLVRLAVDTGLVEISVGAGA